MHMFKRGLCCCHGQITIHCRDCWRLEQAYRRRLDIARNEERWDYRRTYGTPSDDVMT